MFFFSLAALAQAPPPKKLSDAPPGETNPNIIYIMADDLGYFDLGSYRSPGASNPYNETPHLDSLERHGLRFTQAYAASPVCSPSRAAILTGRHPARYGLTNFIAGNRTDPTSPVNPCGRTSAKARTCRLRCREKSRKWPLSGKPGSSR
ncbi:sulfatase-like hydrolase/transferase [Salmonirosea aquatica]|uniref:sulfatase-like hydrolase/transferase n=1 Tax=Salmonirosea aquatica TaxID=2654236 RepID=UPI003571626F